MQCVSPYLVKNDKFPKGLEVPCGNCLACRITRSSVWAQRIIHELDYHEGSIFATLTYSPENVPDGYSLRKRDLQLFFKRLRKSLGARKIKYYACGEYGDTYHRPHYHAVIFGLTSSDTSLVEQCWSLGYCHFGGVSFDSAQYVAGYINKKLTGKLAKINYEGTGREPPFNVMSNGLGLRYCLDNQDFIKQNKFLTLRGQKVPIPRFYRKKLNMDFTDFAEFFEDKKISDIKYHATRNPGVTSTIPAFSTSSTLTSLDAVAPYIENSRDILNRTLKARLQSKRKNNLF